MRSNNIPESLLMLIVIIFRTSKPIPTKRFSQTHRQRGVAARSGAPTPCPHNHVCQNGRPARSHGVICGEDVAGELQLDGRSRGGGLRKESHGGFVVYRIRKKESEYKGGHADGEKDGWIWHCRRGGNVRAKGLVAE